MCAENTAIKRQGEGDVSPMATCSFVEGRNSTRHLVCCMATKQLLHGDAANKSCSQVKQTNSNCSVKRKVMSQIQCNETSHRTPMQSRNTTREHVHLLGHAPSYLFFYEPCLPWASVFYFYFALAQPAQRRFFQEPCEVCKGLFFLNMYCLIINLSYDYSHTARIGNPR